MRNVLRIACFEIRLVASDRWSIVWLLLMPFIMILFFMFLCVRFFRYD